MDASAQTAAAGWYGMGHTYAEISRKLQDQFGERRSPRTLRAWAQKFRWSRLGDATLALRSRVDELSRLASPTPEQLTELEAKLRILRDQNSGPPTDPPTKEEKATFGKAANQSKKKIGDLRGIILSAVEWPKLYWHQIKFIQDKSRRRMALKSRQIGLTFAIALEALQRIIETGNNQIFISASRKQCAVIRRYIKKIALACLNVTLKGTDEIDVLTDHGPASFHFLSTNSVTDQGYSGDLYLDEFAHIPRLRDVLSTARAIAVQEHYRTTYLTTPSTTAHPSYEIWDSRDDRGRKVKDTISRHKFTLKECVKNGFDLIKIKTIKEEYSKREFKNLFNCEWVPAEDGIFDYDVLESCMVAGPIQWEGRRTIIGVDVSRSATGDNTVMRVLEPSADGKSIRCVHALRLRGKTFSSQAAQLRRLIHAYRAARVNIDTTGQGMGQAVYEKVMDLATQGVRFRRIDYTGKDVKNRLVFHAQSLIEEGLVEWDAEDSDLTNALMAIQQVSTDGGKMTFNIKRGAHGHGDDAVAMMHGLVDFQPKAPGGRVRFARRRGAQAITLRAA